MLRLEIWRTLATASWEKDEGLKGNEEILTVLASPYMVEEELVGTSNWSGTSSPMTESIPVSGVEIKTPQIRNGERMISQCLKQLWSGPVRCPEAASGGRRRT